VKQLVLLFVAVALFSFASECQAQRFGRFLRGRTVVQPRPVVQAPRATQLARPVTGYGSNLHRNYTIRREQQKSAVTGLRPLPRGNVLWAR